MKRMKIKQGKEILQSKFNDILEFQKKGIYPDINFLTDNYSIIYDLCNWSGKYCYELDKLHTLFIKNTIADSSNILIKIEEREFINYFCRELDKINYIIYFLYRIFNYLDRFYLNDENKIPLNKKAFDIFKNEFFIPFKEKIFHYLKLLEDNNLDNKEENYIKKIINLLLYIDISDPEIIRINNEFFWRNENENLSNNKIKNNTFDDWFNNYFMKFIESTAQTEAEKIQNLEISEYISSFLKLNWKPKYLKKFFDDKYYSQIINYFNDILLKKKIEEIEKYFFDMDKEQLKKFYQENKEYENCLNLILESFIYSAKNNGIKIFENK